MQFGRPIGQFQAVQHFLAEIAGEVVIADVAVSSAVAKIAADPAAAPALVAAARVNTCRAAGTVATLAHQIHGAIGTTHEHHLRLSTTRLLSWREEYGNDYWWAQRLGELAHGDPWPFVTAL